jgi:Tol biopolymer transport system component
MVTPDRKDYIASYSFSPDGREIVFVSEGTTDKSVAKLWIARADGSVVRQIDVGMANVWAPSWRPPDGAEIIFAGSPPAGAGDGLYAVDPGTGAVRRILAPADGIALDWAAVSPDGSRIAYTASLPSDGDRNTDVVRVVGTDGSGDRALPMPAPATFQETPVWSNDGTRLVFVRGYDTQNQDVVVAIAPADGSGTGVETHHGLTGCCTNLMEWAPDDRSILLLPEDSLGLMAGHKLIDPSTGAVTPAPWTATSLPTWQRRAP